MYTASNTITNTENIQLTAKLNVYLYYNDSATVSEGDDVRFTELMKDSILETYHVISDNNQQLGNDAFSIGDIINVTFCVMFNEPISTSTLCGTFDETKSSQDISSGYVSNGILSNFFC